MYIFQRYGHSRYYHHCKQRVSISSASAWMQQQSGPRPGKQYVVFITKFFRLLEYSLLRSINQSLYHLNINIVDHAQEPPKVLSKWRNGIWLWSVDWNLVNNSSLYHMEVNREEFHARVSRPSANKIKFLSEAMCRESGRFHSNPWIIVLLTRKYLGFRRPRWCLI